MNFSARWASAIAIPTALHIPCPRGPVVISTPFVWPYSGWPGVKLPTCLKFLISSIVTPYPNKCNKEYSSIDPCPADKTNLSLLSQSGFFPLWFIFVHNVNAIVAAPSGRPGCPEFDFCIASADKTLIALIDNLSNSLLIVILAFYLFYFLLLQNI